jgi:hypothetical protein
MTQKYTVVRRRRPNVFDWTEALQTLKGMKPGKNMAFFIPVPAEDSLSAAAEDIDRASLKVGTAAYIEAQHGSRLLSQERGLWVWRV